MFGLISFELTDRTRGLVDDHHGPVVATHVPGRTSDRAAMTPSNRRSSEAARVDHTSSSGNFKFG